MKWTQILCCVGSVGLLVSINMAWYIQNIPVTLTAEQETTFRAGFEGTDCLPLTTGGCSPYGSEPDLIQCPQGVSTGDDCGQTRWSIDSTPHKTCQTITYWIWDTPCGVIDPYHCVERFTVCTPGSGDVHHCSLRSNAPGSHTATDCEN
jgi:hypothetical protein